MNGIDRVTDAVSNVPLESEHIDIKMKEKDICLISTLTRRVCGSCKKSWGHPREAVPEYRLKLEAPACVSFVSCKHRSLTSFKIPLINGFRAIGS